MILLLPQSSAIFFIGAVFSVSQKDDKSEHQYYERRVVLQKWIMEKIPGMILLKRWMTCLE